MWFGDIPDHQHDLNTRVRGHVRVHWRTATLALAPGDFCAAWLMECSGHRPTLVIDRLGSSVSA